MDGGRSVGVAIGISHSWGDGLVSSRFLFGRSLGSDQRIRRYTNSCVRVSVFRSSCMLGRGEHQESLEMGNILRRCENPLSFLSVTYEIVRALILHPSILYNCMFHVMPRLALLRLAQKIELFWFFTKCSCN